MEEIGDPEKYSMGVFYNNVRVLVERMPGNPRVITSMRVYDSINNKSATVDLLEPVLEENHEGKRSICARLVEMAGRTRQNSDYRLEKNAAVTVSERKSDYCMSTLSGPPRQSEKTTENVVTRKPDTFDKPVNDDAGKSLAAYRDGESPKAGEIANYGKGMIDARKKASDNKNLENKGKKTPPIGTKKKAVTGEPAKKPYLGMVEED